MKKYQLKAACEAFKKFKVNKIEDKEIKNALIDNHFAILDEQEEFEKKVEKAKKVYMGSYEEEAQEVQKLQDELQKENNPEKREELIAEINKHEKLFEANAKLNKELMKLGEEEVKLTPIPQSKFKEAYLKMDDYDASIVEALKPMLDKTL